MTDTSSSTSTMMRTETARADLLGELLAFERIVANVSLDHMSQRCGLEIAELEDLERGDQELSAFELSSVIDGYFDVLGIEPMTNVALEVDLEGLAVSIAKPRRAPAPLAPADQNVVRYLELMHRAAGSSADESILISGVDLSLLRGALALRQDGVERHMDQADDQPPIFFRKAFIVAGLVVVSGIMFAAASPSQGAPAIDVISNQGAATAPANGTNAEATTSPTAPAELRLGTPVSIDPEELLRREAAVSPQPQIGTAIVVERGADGVVTSRIPGTGGAGE